LQTANLSEQVVITADTIPEEEDVLKSTPFIPQSVYDNLPPILLESCKAFNDKGKETYFNRSISYTFRLLT
jgi:hypothetical protein